MVSLRIKLDLGDCRPIMEYAMPQAALPWIMSELQAGNLEYVELVTENGLSRFKRR